MTFEQVLDVVVLVATLLAGAAGVLLVLSALGEIPGPRRNARSLLFSLVAIGLILLLLEWRVVH